MSYMSDAINKLYLKTEELKNDLLELSRVIHSNPEIKWKEYKAVENIKSLLIENGLEFNSVENYPTAFVSSIKGKREGPVIAFLAEYDALPSIGHACGHNLIAMTNVGAFLSFLALNGDFEGEIRLIGTPAEEGGGGKISLLNEGLFDDVDIVLDWHASDKNAASPVTSMANRSAKFRFYGYSAHAAGAPEKARSSLDAVEAMNFMVNLMREHIPDGSRIHYVITKGGNAPNVVPDFAEVFYYVRDFDVNILEDMWSRLINTAEAAALGTGTRMEYEIIHGNRPVLPNEVVQKVMYDNLVQVGGVSYTRAEQKFAKEIYKTLIDPSLSISSAKTIQPYKFTKGKGSTDVGDVSWKTPTARLRVATWVPGTSAHTWQAVAAGGMSIGMKGMINASKVLVGAAIDLYNDPKTVKNAKKELIERRGPGFNYYSMLGDRNPPLDYRK